MDSVNLKQQQQKMKKPSWLGKEVRVDLGGVGGVAVIKIHYMKLY